MRSASWCSPAMLLAPAHSLPTNASSKHTEPPRLVTVYSVASTSQGTHPAVPPIGWSFPHLPRRPQPRCEGRPFYAPRRRGAHDQIEQPQERVHRAVHHGTRLQPRVNPRSVDGFTRAAYNWRRPWTEAVPECCLARHNPYLQPEPHVSVACARAHGPSCVRRDWRNWASARCQDCLF